MENKNLIYGYALNEKGQLTHISQIYEQNKNDIYTCPLCGKRMVPHGFISNLEPPCFNHIDQVHCNPTLYLHKAAALALKQKFDNPALDFKVTFLKSVFCEQHNKCALFKAPTCSSEKPFTIDLKEFYDTCEVALDCNDYYLKIYHRKKPIKTIYIQLGMELMLGQKLDAEKDKASIIRVKIDSSRDILELVLKGICEDAFSLEEIKKKAAAKGWSLDEALGNSLLLPIRFLHFNRTAKGGCKCLDVPVYVATVDANFKLDFLTFNKGKTCNEKLLTGDKIFVAKFVQFKSQKELSPYVMALAIKHNPDIKHCLLCCNHFFDGTTHKCQYLKKSIYTTGSMALHCKGYMLAEELKNDLLKQYQKDYPAMVEVLPATEVIALRNSIKITKEQLLRVCRFYPTKSPLERSPDRLFVALMRVEYRWVQDSIEKSENITMALNEYYQEGLQFFEVFDPTPTSLKAYFWKWYRHRHEGDVNNEGFKLWYQKEIKILLFKN